MRKSPDDVNSTTDQKSSVTNLIDPLLKLATASLGVMYIFGLLITNTQLMALGIADFSSVLRIRNIMTGGTFVIYLMFFFLPVMVISLWVAAGLHIFLLRKATRLRYKVIEFVAVTCCVIIIGVACSSMAAQVVGLMLPWGKPWGSFGNINSPVMSSWKEEVWIYDQFSYVYGRATVFTAAVTAILLFWILGDSLYGRIRRCFVKADKVEKKLRIAEARLWRSRRFRAVFGVGTALVLLFVTALLLFDYASGLYPNVRYNVGGGQPRIVRLDIETKDMSLIRLLGAETYADSADKGKAVTTSPLALWHQDEGFFYLSPLLRVGQGSVKVLAVDSKAVHTIYYLPGYVKVGSGGNILSTLLPDSNLESPTAK